MISLMGNLVLWGRARKQAMEWLERFRNSLTSQNTLHYRWPWQLQARRPHSHSPRGDSPGPCLCPAGGGGQQLQSSTFCPIDIYDALNLSSLALHQVPKGGKGKHALNSTSTSGSFSEEQMGTEKDIKRICVNSLRRLWCFSPRWSCDHTNQSIKQTN